MPYWFTRTAGAFLDAPFPDAAFLDAPFRDSFFTGALAEESFTDLDFVPIQTLLV
jgi:hypothetical protein